jgi:hypothetical protein
LVGKIVKVFKENFKSAKAFEYILRIGWMKLQMSNKHNQGWYNDTQDDNGIGDFLRNIIIVMYYICIHKFLSFKKPLLKFLWKKSILYVQCKGNEKGPQRMTDIGSRRQSKLC